MSLKLYTSQVCPFAHRCRLMLAWKGLQSERMEIDLAAMPDWYRQLSPNQKVPLLDHDGQLIWESAIINEYLDDAFEDDHLLRSPLQRARARLVIERVGSQLIPAFYRLLREPAPESFEAIQQAVEALPADMDASGPFWLGPRASLADLAVYPWIERWGVLEHYRNLEVNWPGRVLEWRQAMSEHPAVLAEARPGEFYVPGYARYANP